MLKGYIFLVLDNDYRTTQFCYRIVNEDGSIRKSKSQGSYNCTNIAGVFELSLRQMICNLPTNCKFKIIYEQNGYSMALDNTNIKDLLTALHIELDTSNIKDKDDFIHYSQVKHTACSDLLGTTSDFKAKHSINECKSKGYHVAYICSNWNYKSKKREGSWGLLIYDDFDRLAYSASGYAENTTQNRMLLTACIKVAEWSEGQTIKVVTDSMYVIDVLQCPSTIVKKNKELIGKFNSIDASRNLNFLWRRYDPKSIGMNGAKDLSNNAMYEGRIENRQ